MAVDPGYERLVDWRGYQVGFYPNVNPDTSNVDDYDIRIYLDSEEVSYIASALKPWEGIADSVAQTLVDGLLATYLDATIEGLPEEPSGEA
jgi:hypothetical protein